MAFAFSVQEGVRQCVSVLQLKLYIPKSANACVVVAMSSVINVGGGGGT
jgi:hypothetical protein